MYPLVSVVFCTGSRAYVQPFEVEKCLLHICIRSLATPTPVQVL